VKIFKYLIVSFALAVSGVTYAYANVVRLVLIDYSDFREVDGNTYISNELPADAEQKVSALLVGARNRIAAHYGNSNAEPVIIVLGSQEELKNYGLNDSPGMLLFVPWNSYVLLNYQMADVNVVAHELVHAEIVHRVGYLKRQFNIPTWFDEGAAMQVDYRPEYDSVTAVNQAEFLRLTSLDTPGKFWGRNTDQNVRNYRVSKSAVSEIFKHSDESLYSILAKVCGDEETVMATLVHKTNKALQWTSR